MLPRPCSGSNERRSILITKASRAPQLRLTLERRFRQGDHRAAENSYLCIYFDMEVIEVNRKFVLDGPAHFPFSQEADDAAVKKKVVCQLLRIPLARLCRNPRFGIEEPGSTPSLNQSI